MARSQVMTRAVRRVVASFWSRFGAVLLVGGLALTLIGAWVQVSRWSEVNAAESENRPPAASQGPATPAVAVSAGATITRAIEAGPHQAALGAPDHLTIPAIGLSTRVVPVGWTAKVMGGEGGQVKTEWQTADFAAGFHQNSALLGLPGNTVISGHNNILGEVFKDLHKLKTGDRIVVGSGAASRTFAVSDHFIVREAGAKASEHAVNAAWIAPTEDERLTLVTCYPPWSNTHRTIVIAFPVADEPAKAGRQSELAR